MATGTECVVGPNPVGLWMVKPATIFSTVLSRLFWKNNQIFRNRQQSIRGEFITRSRVSLLTWGVKVSEVIRAVLGGVASCWSVVPTQPAVPATTAEQTCHTSTHTETFMSLFTWRLQRCTACSFRQWQYLIYCEEDLASSSLSTSFHSPGWFPSRLLSLQALLWALLQRPVKTGGFPSENKKKRKS